MAQWQEGDSETSQAVNMLLSFLLDSTNKNNAYKQAIKSVCTLLRNREVQRQPILLSSVKHLIDKTFKQGSSSEDAGMSHQSLIAKQMALLHFLSAALQVMPGQMCCDTANSIISLLHSSTEPKIRTTCYLTLEVVYASRRLYEHGDHMDSVIRQLVGNPEMADLAE